MMTTFHLPHTVSRQLPWLLALVAIVASSQAVLAGNWRVQVMVVHELALAEQVEARLEHDGYEHVGIHWRNGQYKVWAGAEETRAGAIEYQQRLIEIGFEDAFVVQAGPDSNLESGAVPIVADQPYAIQIFSLSSREAADRAVAEAKQGTGYNAFIVEGDGLYRVQLGPFESRDAADFARQVVTDRGYADTFLVPREE